MASRVFLFLLVCVRSFSLVSINCNGLRTKSKLKNVFSLLQIKKTEDSNNNDGSDDSDYRTFMTMEETRDGDNLEHDDTGSGELFIAETQPETIDTKRRRETTTENDETEDYDPDWTPSHRAQRRSQRRRVATMTVTKDGPVKTANQYEVLQDNS